MKTSIIAASLVVQMALMSVAHAGDKPQIGFTATGATDYVWRGFSQTNAQAAVFASVNASYKGFYVGAGTENVNFGGTKQEYDLWGGYVLPIGPVKLDVGAVRYGYTAATRHIDTLEGKVAISGSIGKLGLGAAAYHTGNYFGSRKAATYTEANASYAITPKLSLSAALGHQQVNRARDYTTWNIGASYQIVPHGTIGVRYHDTNTRQFGKLGKSRIVGSFSLSF